jgi:hypothetical protein
MGLPERYSWFSGAEVDDARVGYWRRRHARLYLVTMPFHMGADVYGLACPLHHPTVCGCQTRGQSPDAAFIYLIAKLLPGALLPMLIHMLPLSSWGSMSLDGRRPVQSL